MLIPRFGCSYIILLQWKTCLEKLKSLFSHVTPHLRVPCDSRAHNLCVSHVLIMHMAYARPSVVAFHPRRSYTSKIFYLMTWTTILAFQSVGFRREEVMALSLGVEDNSHHKSLEILTYKGVFIGLFIGLKWLKSIKVWATLSSPKQVLID